MPAGQGVVEGNEIPYQPWALAKQKENFAKRATADPETKCYLPGVPRIMYMPLPFQIVQVPTKMVMLFEYAHAIRHIYTNGNAHPPGHIDWWIGDSRGRWDGDTFVVDIVHFNDETWFDRAGNFHSDAAARGRAVHAHRSRSHRLRGHDRRSEGLHAAVEDEHADLSPQGGERAAPGIRVLRLRVGKVLPLPEAVVVVAVTSSRGGRSESWMVTLVGGGGDAALPVARAGVRRARAGPGRDAWTGARTADGQPDIQGTWRPEISGGRSIEDPGVPGGIEDEIARSQGKSKKNPSRVVNPADGKVPYQPWAAALRAARWRTRSAPRSRNTSTRRRAASSSAPIRQSANANQFLQMPGSVVLVNEAYHNYRVIPVDGRPALPGTIKLWGGDSRGRGRATRWSSTCGTSTPRTA